MVVVVVSGGSTLCLSVPAARPAAEAFGLAGPSSAAAQLRPARQHRGALRAAAGGLGGGEDGQVPPHPRARKEMVFGPAGGWQVPVAAAGRVVCMGFQSEHLGLF